MRTIKIKTWETSLPNGEVEKEGTLMLLNALIMMKRPEEMPKGIEQFRMFNRIGTAFENAEKSGELKLEETEYNLLKGSIEKDIPAAWGMNKNIILAIDSFLNAKEEVD